MATWGGVGTYSVEILRALTRLPPTRGVRILALRREADRHLVDVPEFADVEWMVTNKDPWSPRGALEAGLAARGRVDLYHAPHVTVPMGFDGPLVTTIHDVIPLLAPQTMPSRLRRIAFRAAVRQATRRSGSVICVSRATAASLIREGFCRDYCSRHLRVVHNGRDPRFCPQSPDVVARVRRAYGLPDSYILWLGAFRPHKNVSTLVDAYRQLPMALRGSHALVLAGSLHTQYARTIRELARTFMESRAGAGSRIVFPGPIEAAHLPALYSGATVFAFPSLIEGFGLPPLEAAACGTPALVSAREPFPEILGNGALYVDPLNAAEMAQSLEVLLSDHAARAAVARRGLMRSRAFTWERAAAETLQAYRTALGTRRP